MIYEADARFLRALISGSADPQGPGVLARLATMRAMYRSRGDGGMCDLIWRAHDAYTAALARAEVAADRAYLEGMLDGTLDLLSESVFTRIEPMFSRYAEGSDMYALLERAVMAFDDAAQEFACWILAGVAIDEARHKDCFDD